MLKSIPEDQSAPCIAHPFQYQCKDQSSWTAVNELVTAVTVCEYSMHQLVECSVKAYNAAGDGEVASISSYLSDGGGESLMTLISSINFF